MIRTEKFNLIIGEKFNPIISVLKILSYTNSCEQYESKGSSEEFSNPKKKSEPAFYVEKLSKA